MVPDSRPDPVADRLDSWKDIAAYLRRDVSTVQRWEKKQGLPVHRHLHEKQGSIYAFKSELDEWWRQADYSDETTDRSERKPAARKHVWLRFAAIASATVIALVALGLVTRASRGSTASDAPIRSVAVLPLTNLMGADDQEYYVAAMHDALIAELGQLRALNVISRTSVMQYQKTDKSTPQIARELKVDALVEGSVFRSGERVRVQVQLVKPIPIERQLWSRTFDGELQDVMVLQKEIARAIAEQMKLTLSPQEAARLAATRKVNPAAHDAYAKGWFQFNRMSVEAAHKCVASADQALAADPSYARAYALSALCQGLLANLGGGVPDDLQPRAAAAARHALELDDSLADAHFALAWTLSVYDRDWVAAEQEYRRGLDLNPGSSIGHARYGWFLGWMNRKEQALAEVEQGALLDPASADQLQRVSAVHFVARRYDEAILAARTAIAIEPTFAFGHLRLGQAYMEKGMHELGIAAMEKAVELSANVNTQGSLGRAYAMAGRRHDARRILHALLNPGEHTNAAWTQIAQIYVALDEKEEALRWLEEGYRMHDGDMALLKVFPPWDPLRSDPRFQDLLTRLKFP